MNLEFFNRVQNLVNACPASWESGDRTVGHNSAIGGAKMSYHLQGLAQDLVYDSIPLLIQAAKKAKDQGFMGIELDATNYHLHVDGRSTVWHVACFKDGSIVRKISLIDYLTEYDGGFII